MAALMEKLDRLDGSGPALLAGDLNSSTFARGTRWRTFHGITKLLLSRPPRLMESLVHPDHHDREPLFEVLKRHGFSVQEFNSREATHRASLTTLEENDYLPPALQRWGLKKLDQYNHQLDLKLDWIAGRSVKALTANELRDAKSGVVSVSPQAVKSVSYQGRRISDHDPIIADIQLI